MLLRSIIASVSKKAWRVPNRVSRSTAEARARARLYSERLHGVKGEPKGKRDA